jgi:hypothetical protein
MTGADSPLISLGCLWSEEKVIFLAVARRSLRLAYGAMVMASVEYAGTAIVAV